MKRTLSALILVALILNSSFAYCAYSPKNANGQATMANSEPVVIASDQSAVPVSGTVTANAGSGTMAVSAASLPLPSGASTAAKQPALGAAGTASSDVITVQGIASMTALKVDGSAVTQPISGTVTANAGSGTMAVSLASVPSHAVTNAGTFAVQDSQVIADNGAFTDGTSKLFPAGFIYDEVAGTALTENDIAAPRVNVNRATVSTIEDGATRARYATVTAANALKVDNSGVTQPVSGTVTVTDGAGALNVIIDSGTTAVTNAGTFVTQENGALLTSAQLIDDAVATTAAAITTKGIAASGTDGTNARILKTDTSGELQVDVLTVPTITVNSHAVTNAGTFATQESGALLTSAQLIDDAVYASDAVLSKTLGVGAVLDDTATVAITENQAGYLRMSPRRALLVEGVASGTAQAVSAASGSIASGAIASGAVASGAFASGSIASGAIASGAIAAGAIAAGATSIAENEDTASADLDRGIKILAVRRDTPVSGANVSATSDYLPLLTDSFGKLWSSGTVPEDTAHVDLEAITAMGQRRIDTLATSSGTSGDWSSANQSAEGAEWATLSPTTTSGLSVANFTSGDTYTALTNTAQVIKASAGNLYGYYIYNPNATAAYVMVYNVAAASVTVGTTTALLVFCIPATSGANLMFPYPITFSNAGWSIAAATTGGGNTAPTTALEAMIWYK